MIVRSHSELPEMDEARRVAAVVSLPGTFARSVGATLADVPALFGDPDLEQGHARMTGRWAMPAPAFGPLQKLVNAILFDSQLVAFESADDVQSHSFSALSLARSVLLQIYFDNGDEEFVEGAINNACELLKNVGPEDHERTDRGERYASFLPMDRQVDLIDAGTVESVLGVMVGLQRSDLVACGLPKSRAAGYLNGREEWTEESAFYLLVERVGMAMFRIRQALPAFDDPATESQKVWMNQLTPAETCTMWQLFPVARAEIERWSPWMFKFGETE